MTPIRTAVAAGVLALLLLAVFTVRSCSSDRRDAAQDRHEARAAEAYAGAAKGAVARVVGRAREESELKDVVTEAAQEIANVEGSDQPVPPAARDAALSAACRLRSYRDEPACQMLRADP